MAVASVQRTPPARPRRTANPGGALVIGGDYRALGIVRSLGRRGIPVRILTDEHRIAAASRYVQQSLPWPDLDPASQVAFLLRLATQERLDGWVLFPSGDEPAALLAQHHAALSERFRLTVPDWKVTRWAYDKRLANWLAVDAGVDHPWTRYPRSREEVAALACTFPVVIKPTHKERQLNSFTAAKAWRVDNRQELLRRYDEARALVPADVIMIQELIRGGGAQQFSFAALCQDGEPLASIVARRARQYPEDFGRFSTFVETIDHPEVERAARRLLLTLGYTGLIEIEFKRDPASGRYLLLDINPRVWGWHTLGQRAGVDFPYLHWQLIRGQDVPQVRARPGVRWVRMLPDLPAAARKIWRRELSLQTYLRAFHGPMEFAIYAQDDPLPALADLPLSVYLSARRLAPAFAQTVEDLVGVVRPRVRTTGPGRFRQASH